MNKKILLITFFLLVIITAGAQNRKATISGYVRDAKSNEPLTQAVIYTEDKKVGVAADVNGYYSLSVTPGKQKIYCAYFGYSTAEAVVEPGNTPLQVNFMLEMDPAGEIPQAQVAKVKAFITENMYTCSDGILQDLGRMYAGAGSMRENIDAAGGPGTAEYAHRAIEAWCKGKC